MRTVLVIDDDAQFRNWVARYLQDNGWRVLQAGDGDEGIAVAEAHRPQAILLDLLMPRCNGFLACQTLRSNEALQQSRIFVTSGRDFEGDRQEALNAGADVYITKPINLDQLLLLLAQPETGAASARPRPPASLPQEVLPPPPAMPPAPASLRFWGVRGSVPTPGPATVRYGGNTSCLEVRADGQIIILDAGTGLRLLGQDLLAEFGRQPIELTLLLTHTHWDHIQGLPFFLPLLRHQMRLRILGYEGARQGLHDLLASQMEHPFFPVSMPELAGRIHVEELKDLSFDIGPVRVRAAYANHPGICVGYRLATASGAIAYFPDHEPHLARERWPMTTAGPTLEHARREHQKLVTFLGDTDVLIMDTQYDCREYQEHHGWGHGCLDDVVTLALEAGVKHLFLFHHDPDHDDDQIERMVAHARDRVARQAGALSIEAAREGAAFELPIQPAERLGS